MLNTAEDLRRKPYAGSRSWPWAILLISLLVCCLAAPARGVELQVWAMGAEGKLIRQMADRFEALNPGVTILTQAVSWGTAHEKLVTSIVGNMEPDVCQLGTTWMAEFHTLGALEPIGPWLASSSISLNGFFPSSLDSNRFGGEFYGVPWYVDTRVFFYRKDLAADAGFARFPETWDDLKTLARNLKKLKAERGIPGFVYGPGIGDWQILLMYYWQCGGEIQPDMWPGPVFSRVCLDEAFRHIISFYDEELSHRDRGGEQELLAGTESGYYPMFISGPWMVNDLESRPGLSGKWTTAPLPRHRRRTSFLGGSNLVMFRGSKNKELAWKFIEFMSSAESQAAWYEISRDLPASQEAWKKPALADRPHLEAFRQQLLDARAPPPLPEWEAMAERISHRYTQIMQRHVGLDEGMVLIQEDCGAILERSGVRQGIPFSWPLAMALMFVPALLAGIYLWRDPAPFPSLRLRSRVWPFLLPALLLVLLFRFLPGAACLVTSLTNWDIYGLQDPGRVRFIGIENFLMLAEDPAFWYSVRNILAFVLIGVPLNIFTALVVALVLDQPCRSLKGLSRTLFFLPSVTTLAAAAMVWQRLYAVEGGLLNQVVGWFGLAPVPWLSHSWFALPALIIMTVWKGFGLNAAVFLAALQGVPDDLYEQVEIDGGSWWHKIRHVTLPYLQGSLVFVFITTTVGTFHVFTEPYIMTGGGPLHATITPVLHLYQNGFQFFRLGYASAITCTLSLGVIAFNVFQQVIRRKWGQSP